MSPLHHFLGLVRDDYSGTLYAGDVVIFSIRRKREEICCSICRSLNVVRIPAQAATRFRFIPPPDSD